MCYRADQSRAMGQVLQLLKGKEVADVFIDFESKSQTNRCSRSSSFHIIELGVWCCVRTSAAITEAQPTAGEMKIWTAVNEVLKNGEATIKLIDDYKGCKNEAQKVL